MQLSFIPIKTHARRIKVLCFELNYKDTLPGHALQVPEMNSKSAGL